MKLLEDRLTEHFWLHEFSNTQDGDVVLYNPEFRHFVDMLEEFRVWYNRRMTITSGYRTKAFNKKIGGASNSYHLKQLAADFSLPSEYYRFSKARKEEFLNNVKSKWYEICEKHEKTGSVIWYDTIIHLSWWPDWYFEDKRGK